MGVGVKFGLFRPQRRGERLKASIISHPTQLLCGRCSGWNAREGMRTAPACHPCKLQARPRMLKSGAGVHFPDSRFRLKHSRTSVRGAETGLFRPLMEAAKALIDALQKDLDAYLITYNTKQLSRDTRRDPLPLSWGGRFSCTEVHKSPDETVPGARRCRQRLTSRLAQCFDSIRG